MLRSPRRLLLAAGTTALAAGLVVGGLWLVERDGDQPDGGATGAASTEGGSAGGGEGRPEIIGTVQEPSVGDPVPADPEPVVTGGAVSVMVTHGGWVPPDGPVEVDGFVTGVVEDGGTCRVTLTRDGEELTAEGVGAADATTTICPSVSLGDAELAAGTWQAVLSYSSPTSTGASAPMEILVPNR